MLGYIKIKVKKTKILRYKKYILRYKICRLHGDIPTGIIYYDLRNKRIDSFRKLHEGRKISYVVIVTTQDIIPQETLYHELGHFIFWSLKRSDREEYMKLVSEDLRNASEEFATDFVDIVRNKKYDYRWWRIREKWIRQHIS